MKRFYTAVAITSAGGITLDGRPVRTPARALLEVPSAALASAIAAEWAAQGEEIDPRSMPMTGLANAAIDRVPGDRATFAAGLAAYAETELLCYRAAEPPELVVRQNEVWNPVLDWARGRYDASFTLVTGIMHQPQPPATLARLADAVLTQDAWHLAALSPLITISGSLIVALAVVEGALKPQAAFDIAHLDELWQAELWGEDYFALEARAVRQADFLNAVAFLALLRG